MGSLSLEFIEGDRAGESESEEFGEAAEGLFEIWKGKRFANEGEIKVSEVAAFGEGWEAVDSACC